MISISSAVALMRNSAVESTVWDLVNLVISCSISRGQLLIPSDERRTSCLKIITDSSRKSSGIVSMISFASKNASW